MLKLNLLAQPAISQLHVVLVFLMAYASVVLYYSRIYVWKMHEIISIPFQFYSFKMQITICCYSNRTVCGLTIRHVCKILSIFASFFTIILFPLTISCSLRWLSYPGNFHVSYGLQLLVFDCEQDLCILNPYFTNLSMVKYANSSSRWESAYVASQPFTFFTVRMAVGKSGNLRYSTKILN